MVVVADSGPILSFARANLLELLHEVMEEIVIPAAVAEELGSALVSQGRLRHRSVRDPAFMAQLPQKLHRGEQEAIVLARELGALLLVDEREARKEARRLGVPHLGSLRVLKEAKDRGIVSAAKPVLDTLIATGTYLSKLLYQEFLRQVGE